MKAPKEHFEFNFKIAFGICQWNLDCFGGLLDFNSGGKKVIERLVEAYGFTTRQALCDHLGVSKSTMATRYMRDIFPADWVIQCAIETGSSLEWLSFGVGKNTASSKTLTLNKYKLENGIFQEVGSVTFDTSLLSFSFDSLIYVYEGDIGYILEKKVKNILDGQWLLDIDGQVSIRKIRRIPGNNLRVESDDFVFDCNINDINLIGLVVKTFK